MRPAQQGLLLLCARLGREEKPLSQAEYRALARRVRAVPQENGQSELTQEFLCALGYDSAQAQRILRLLDGKTRMEEYLAAAPEVSALTRICPEFPERLRALDGQCPPVLFCLGDVSLLRTRCIALVGSRRIEEKNRAFAARIGALCAKEGFTLVSGDASGADRAAQEACLSAGGQVVSFVPDELFRREARKNLLYCSAEGYDCPFSAARALARNRFIHALGEKTFVAQSSLECGGTWQGTTENLAHGYSPVFVYDDESVAAKALIARGAEPVLRAVRSVGALSARQQTLPL